MDDTGTFRYLLPHAEPFGQCPACGPEATRAQHDDALLVEATATLSNLTNELWTALHDLAGTVLDVATDGTVFRAPAPRDFYVVPADPFTR